MNPWRRQNRGFVLLQANTNRKKQLKGLNLRKALKIGKFVLGNLFEKHNMFPDTLNAKKEKTFPNQVLDREKIRKVRKFRKISFAKKLVIY